MRFTQTKEPLILYRSLPELKAIAVPYYYARCRYQLEIDPATYQRIQVDFQPALRPRQHKKVTKLDQLFDATGCAILSAHPGFGKTMIGSYYVGKFSFLTCIVAPMKILLTQWQEALEKAYPQIRVTIVQNETTIDQAKLNQTDVFICMPLRWKQLSAKLREKVGFLIIDEAHMFCTASRIDALLQFEPKYILALTATPFRQDNAFKVIEKICGTKQVTANYRTPVDVWGIQTKLKFETARNAAGGVDWVNTIKKVVQSDERNLIIIQILRVLIEAGRKVLVMTNFKYHVKEISRLLKQENLQHDFLMENKMAYQDSPILISIIQKAGTGFDEQFACQGFNGSRIDTLLYLVSVKDEVGLTQYGGRTFRSSDPLIIHLVDNNPILKRHWTEAKKFYREKSIIKQLKLSEVALSEIITSE